MTAKVELIVLENVFTGSILKSELTVRPFRPIKMV